MKSISNWIGKTFWLNTYSESLDAAANYAFLNPIQNFWSDFHFIKLENIFLQFTWLRFDLRLHFISSF